MKEQAQEKEMTVSNSEATPLGSVTGNKKISNSSSNRIAVWVAVLGVSSLIGVVGVFLGMQLSKDSSAISSPQNMSAPSGQISGGPSDSGGRPNRRMGAMGTVTAISDNSITIKDTMQNSEVTFTLDAATTVSDSGSDSSIDAIKVGDTVFVRTSSTNDSSSSSSNVASAIEINPTMPSGSGGPANANSTTVSN